MKLQSLAKPLGWFSLALGLAEIVGGKRIASAHGAPKASPLVRGFGAREIAAGAAVLARPRSPIGLWARAAGDVLDIAAAGTAAATARRATPRKIALGSLAFVAGALALDVLVARSLQKA